jgi:hypothetical protein
MSQDPLKLLEQAAIKEGNIPFPAGKLQRLLKEINEAIDQARPTIEAWEAAFLIHRLMTSKGCAFLGGCDEPTIDRIIEFLLRDYNMSADNAGLPRVE